MTANEIPASQHSSAAAAQAAIDEADALRAAHADDDYSDPGMVHAGVAAQLAAAKASLAIAEAIRELTAAVRDRPTP